MGMVTDMFSGGGTGLNQKAADMYMGIENTDYQKQIDLMNKAVLENKVNPETYKAAIQGRSSLEDYQVDPRLKMAQRQALSSLEDIANSGGMTAMDRGRMNQIQQEGAGIERGNREAIMQNARARGVGGSGLEMASKMMSAQNSANQRANRGFQVQAEAQQRQLAAQQAAGQLAAQQRQQGFGEKQGIASAQDAINRFNSANVTNANQYGANAANQANMFNANTGMGAARDVNKYMENPFDQNLQKVSGAAGQMAAAADKEEARRNSGQQTLSGAAGAAMMFSDENLKTNISDAPEGDVAEFMNTLDFKKYDYKDKSMGEGDQFGMMAQDLEKSKIGKSMVFETPVGKAVDYGKSQAVMLGVLKKLTERVGELEDA